MVPNAVPEHLQSILPLMLFDLKLPKLPKLPVTQASSISCAIIQKLQ